MGVTATDTIHLAQVRRDRGETQVGLAARMGVAQNQVSRLEHQTDALLSTLVAYLGALGGELRLVASFPHGDVTFTLDGGID